MFQTRFYFYSSTLPLQAPQTECWNPELAEGRKRLTGFPMSHFTTLMFGSNGYNDMNLYRPCESEDCMCVTDR